MCNIENEYNAIKYVLLAWAQACRGQITQPHGDGIVSSGPCVYVDSVCKKISITLLHPGCLYPEDFSPVETSSSKVI